MAFLNELLTNINEETIFPPYIDENKRDGYFHQLPLKPFHAFREKENPSNECKFFEVTTNINGQDIDGIIDIPGIATDNDFSFPEIKNIKTFSTYGGTSRERCRFDLFIKPQSYTVTYNLNRYDDIHTERYNREILDDLKKLERYDDPKVRAKFLFERGDDKLMFYFVPNEVLEADALVRYYYYIDNFYGYDYDSGEYLEGWAVDLSKVLLFRQKKNEFYMAEAIESLKRTLEKGNIELVQGVLAPLLRITDYGNDVVGTIFSKLVECGKYANLIPGCGSEILTTASSNFKVASENLSRAAAEE